MTITYLEPTGQRPTISVKEGMSCGQVGDQEIKQHREIHRPL